jgi:hypothetical protein
MQQREAGASDIAVMKVAPQAHAALWSICRGLNCALGGARGVFFPRPVPSEWAALKGERIRANWVNARRPRVILQQGTVE